MATNAARFKDVYAAKLSINHTKLKPGTKLNDLCHVHPNGCHSNYACFQQKAKTAASASNSDNLSDKEMIKRYKSMMNASKEK